MSGRYFLKIDDMLLQVRERYNIDDANSFRCNLFNIVEVMYDIIHNEKGDKIRNIYNKNKFDIVKYLSLYFSEYYLIDHIIIINEYNNRYLKR